MIKITTQLKAIVASKYAVGEITKVVKSEFGGYNVHADVAGMVEEIHHFIIKGEKFVYLGVTELEY